MSGSYPTLGFDPAPGNVAKVTEVADNLGTVAREIGAAFTDLTNIGKSGGIWQGEGAAAFAAKVNELPDYLEKANKSLSGASDTLSLWSQDLSSLQRKAAEYERLAADAMREVKAAESNPDLQLAGQMFSDPAALEQATAALRAAEQRLASAQESLESFREDARRLLEQHAELASDVAAKLRRAKDEAPEEPGLLDEIGDALSKAWDFVEEHADVIAKIGDVLSTIGTVLSVVAVATAWIPGVNAVTAAAAIGVNGAALAAHGLAKAAGADVSWSKMAFDAVGMIPGGGAAKGALGAARVLPKAMRAGRTAAQFADDGARLASGVNAAGKTISRAGAQMVGSRANLANTVIEGGAKLLGKNPDDVSKLAVNSFESGTKLIGDGAKMAHTAQSGAAVATGAGVLAAEKGAMQVAKWEAEPYLAEAENTVKEHAGKAVDGFQNALAARGS
ncbi:putative T7SS-secreted protein [Haloechinothrix halophila]|uniref:putative T7SS-secreted protein n=1 Tax=Haloechinothrix halophila TaxID=1069073 RepID=UPI0003FB706D|nr:hypothetical protein [Haloechinothrix halophila]